jgi:hypothetical protein
MRKTILVVMTAILLLALAAAAMAADPFVGTWKLNVAQSTFPPGQAPKSEIEKIEAPAIGQRCAANRVDATGKETHVVFA